MGEIGSGRAGLSDGRKISSEYARDGSSGLISVESRNFVTNSDKEKNEIYLASPESSEKKVSGGLPLEDLSRADSKKFSLKREKKLEQQGFSRELSWLREVQKVGKEFGQHPEDLVGV